MTFLKSISEIIPPWSQPASGSAITAQLPMWKTSWLLFLFFCFYSLPSTQVPEQVCFVLFFLQIYVLVHPFSSPYQPKEKIKNGEKIKCVSGWFPQYLSKSFSVNPVDAYYNPDTSPYRISHWVQLFRK